MASLMRLLILALFAPTTAFADGLLPGPGEAGSNPALHDLAAAYDRQFHVFNAAPWGIALDAFVPNASHRTSMDDFMAQSAITDFAAFTGGTGVEDVISQRGEYGDLGMFGGVAAAGEAFRYAVVQDAVSRQDLIDAIDAWSVYANITGEPGTIARGIRQTWEVGDAPVPFPAQCPNAWERTENVWRNDESANQPDWYFMDNTSKDQLIGYVYALGAMWDAIADDPSFPQATKDRLQAEASAMGASLMTPVEVRSGTSIDLVIRGARGCLVRFHDINPREVILDNAQPLVLSETSGNRIGFNALVALGIIRTLYHISGDETLRTYYYDELVTNRGYPSVMTTGAARVRNMFANSCVGNNCVVTNFSNVNMAFTAIYGLLRYETDPTLRSTYVNVLENELWTGPRPHMGLEIQQPFFNLLYAGFRSGATDDTQAANAAQQLTEWPTPPYWNPYVENCDANKLTAGTCTAIDGTTQLTLDDVAARGNVPAAEDPLPKRLRIPNNFEWRSDPRVVNGGGGVRLNPGGDFRGAYWLGRMLQSSADSVDNVSPIARQPDGSGGPGSPTMDAGVADTGADLDGGVVTDTGAATDAEPPDASTPDLGGAMDAGAAGDAGGPAKDAEPAVPDTGSAITQMGSADSRCGCSTHGGASPAFPWVLIALLGLRRRR